MESAFFEPFGDGRYRFWLDMARTVAIEREIGIKRPDGAVEPGSIFAIYPKLTASLGVVDGVPMLIDATAVRPSECVSIIRNALISGGEGVVNGDTIKVDSATALTLVEETCFPKRAAAHDAYLAWTILRAAIDGIQVADKKKEAQPAAVNPRRSKRASSSKTAERSVSTGSA